MDDFKQKHRIGRYTEHADLEKDCDELEPGWVLRDWHAVEETMERRAERTGELESWRITVFYAMFVTVPVQVKPTGMRAR